MVGVAREGGKDGGCREGFSQKRLGGPIVRRGVEGADAELEGAFNDFVGGDFGDVGVVEVIECCSAADKGRQGCGKGW